jgi:1-acyl-sn-glycerol-3-phosphate acyltransferase
MGKNSQNAGRNFKKILIKVYIEYFVLGGTFLLYTVAKKFLKGISRLFYKICWKGEEHIPKKGAFIVCCNHRSLIDPLLVAAPFQRQIRFMAKEELFTQHGRLAAWILQSLGAFPVRRETADRKSLQTAEQILLDGGIVGIFPQGYVIRDNRPFSPKSGAVLLSSCTNVPILPMSIFCRGPLKFFSRITVRVGKPLSEKFFQGAKYDHKKLKAGSAALAQAINELLEEEN